MNIWGLTTIYGDSGLEVKTLCCEHRNTSSNLVSYPERRNIMKDKVDVLSSLTARNLHWQLSWTGNKVVLLICSPHWWADSLAQSVPVCEYTGISIDDVLEKARKEWL